MNKIIKATTIKFHGCYFSENNHCIAYSSAKRQLIFCLIHTQKSSEIEAPRLWKNMSEVIIGCHLRSLFWVLKLSSFLFRIVIRGKIHDLVIDLLPFLSWAQQANARRKKFRHISVYRTNFRRPGSQLVSDFSDSVLLQNQQRHINHTRIMHLQIGFVINQ